MKTKIGQLMKLAIIIAISMIAITATVKVVAAVDTYYCPRCGYTTTGYFYPGNCPRDGNQLFLRR